jgi:hypothetical protein
MKGKYDHICVPYGWCALKACVCPGTTDVGCKITDPYPECANFRKAGMTYALEETDGHGKRRIYLATAQGVYSDPKTKKRLRDSSQSQTVFGRRGGV